MSGAPEAAAKACRSCRSVTNASVLRIMPATLAAFSNALRVIGRIDDAGLEVAPDGVVVDPVARLDEVACVVWYGRRDLHHGGGGRGCRGAGGCRRARRRRRHTDGVSRTRVCERRAVV